MPVAATNRSTLGQNSATDVRLCAASSSPGSRHINEGTVGLTHHHLLDLKRPGEGDIRTHVARGADVSAELIWTHRNNERRGMLRWYNDYRLPEHLGGGVVTVRLHAYAEDAKRKFNRAENVRQIPPGGPDFEVLYRRRNDAESINRHLDDTLWPRRAHSIGNRRQL